MFVCFKCCVLSGRGLCDELITRPEESCRLRCVVVCDLENLRNEDAMTRVGSQRHIKKKMTESFLEPKIQERYIILLEPFRTNYRHSGYKDSEVIQSRRYATTNEESLIAKWNIGKMCIDVLEHKVISFAWRPKFYDAIKCHWHLSLWWSEYPCLITHVWPIISYQEFPATACCAVDFSWLGMCPCSYFHTVNANFGSEMLVSSWELLFCFGCAYCTSISYILR